VAYVVAVLLRCELSCRPLAGVDPKTRALDVLVIDDRLAVAGGDAVAALVIRNFDDFPEELVRLLLARACVLVAKVSTGRREGDRVRPPPLELSPVRPDGAFLWNALLRKCWSSVYLE